MSELCLSTTPDSSKFHSLLLNDLYLFSSFILSHPLYFSYFIFFSPYLLKLLSFLSPLFLTTSVLLLTFSPAFAFQFNDPGFLLSTFLTITQTLASKADDQDPYNFEEFEVYKIVFDHTRRFDVREISNEEASEGNCVTKFCTHEEQVSGSGVTNCKAEERKLESFLELLDKFENMGKSNVEEKKVDELPSASPKSNKVVVGELQKEDLVSGSEATATSKPKVTSNCKISGNIVNKDENLDSRRSFDSSRSDLGSYGSMRKEKEWKRTLACKLYEERQNVGGEEGMDSLWETYDTDLSKNDLIAKNKSDDRNSKKKKNRKKSGISTEYYYDLENEDDPELPNGHFCCLQALKLSSGKMNFGMGKPNLVKISKALKGIGWLHHHVIKHGKKDRY